MATAIPTNDAAFRLSEVASAVRTGFDPAKDQAIRGISTDSREDLRGKLFVALSGDRFDGHHFLDAAVAHGAAALLVERPVAGQMGVPVLQVPDSLRALGDIAKAHRSRWKGQLVAVAGSAGKTTTRVAIETVLRSTYGDRVHATRGNLNNQIGVPMTLLGLREAHELAVIEVGTNHPGEVARLSEVCSPDAAVLTLIGLEHTEGLGDLDGVEREEGQVFQFLASRGFAIGNGDDARVLAQMARYCRAEQRFTFGCTPGVDYRATYRVSDALDRTAVNIERDARVAKPALSLETRLLGLPGAMAVSAAVAVADALGVSLDAQAATAALMRSDVGETGRLKAHSLPDGTVLLDDTYNANPPSMLSSIALADELARRRRTRLVLVLGEMRELGEHSVREHTLLGTKLGSAAQVIAVGEQAEPVHRSALACSKSSHYVANSERAADLLLQLTAPGDVVLVKGSRGVRLETVVERVMALRSGAPNVPNAHDERFAS
jgi:UDP-N-acetylmuramoyl-tripeptide--D-alanyl-D-alanine ligase